VPSPSLATSHLGAATTPTFTSASPSGPLSLVQRAREDLKANQRSARRTGAGSFDEIWCVFDVDQHPKLSHAIFEARQSGIEVAISNPCFELWLVLHREDQTANIDRHKIQGHAKHLGIVDGKRFPPGQVAQLIAEYPAAKQRAKALGSRHKLNASDPGSNPSSGVWQLIDRLR